MILRPEIAALRGDDTPQRLAQAALGARLAGWQQDTVTAAIRAEIAAFDAGAALGDCPALGRLFKPGSNAARALVDGFVKAMLTGLAEHPLGHVPLRYFTNGTVSTLLLAQHGNVTLSLMAMDGAALAAAPPPVTAAFRPIESWDQVLAGSAAADLLTHAPAPGATSMPPDRRTIHLAPGQILSRHCWDQALLYRAINDCYVTLTLQRRQANAGPVREVDLTSGALVHLAAGTAVDSRRELMVTLLGRMGRSDAAPVLAEIGQGNDAAGAGGDGLRWQALRECLALDTAAGFAALSAVAAAPADPLAGNAGALVAQLIEAYPQLKALTPCPA